MTKPKRVQIKKGERFELFKRDGFTCQYCGRQPPEATLQIDHIVPVAEGGDNDEMNLITACRSCNLGKGANPLDNPQRPDADLAWLEVQQELAELQDYQTSKQERNELMSAVIELLQTTWSDCSGLTWSPADHIVMQMVTRFGPDLVEQAFLNVAPKVATGYIKRRGWPQYVWGTLNRMEKNALD